MKIANLSGLPSIIHEYLCHDNYDYEAKGNSYSATELLKPTREIILTRRHSKEIVKDSADRIWSLFGSAVHSVLENGKLSDFQEERLKTEIEGIKVSGKADIVKDGVLMDFKCTSVWTIVYGSRVEEWTKQISIYRWLYSVCKNVVLEKAEIIAILRDWAAKDADRDNYPKCPIISIPINLIPIDKTADMVTEKLRHLVSYDQTSDDGLPECSDEDRWYNAKKKTYNKCGKYCDVSSFCSQYKKTQEG